MGRYDVWHHFGSFPFGDWLQHPSQFGKEYIRIMDLISEFKKGVDSEKAWGEAKTLSRGSVSRQLAYSTGSKSIVLI